MYSHRMEKNWIANGASRSRVLSVSHFVKYQQMFSPFCQFLLELAHFCVSGRMCSIKSNYKEPCKSQVNLNLVLGIVLVYQLVILLYC